MKHVNEIERKSIRKKFMSWRCNPDKFILNEVVLGISQPGSGVFQSVTCILTCFTIGKHGQTMDESLNNYEDVNEIEWKSIRRKFMS